MLNRENAPITNDAWDEIDDRAKDVLTNYLSARKVLNVNGPKGWNYTVVPEGRLNETQKDENDTNFGLYKVKPLVESRVEFELSRWELDNLARGAKDIDLDPLENAVKKIALFEENAIYNGLNKASITGLIADSEGKTLEFGKDANAIMGAISDGVIRLKEAFTEGPYTLVVGQKAWNLLNSEYKGYPLIDTIKDIFNTTVVYSHVVDHAILVPQNHDDLEMTLGIDYSIGYQSNDNKNVRFYITESFTYRTLDSKIIVNYKL